MSEFAPKPGFAFPGPVPQEALEYFRGKGWRISFDHREVWAAEHTAVFTVAKAMQMDVLRAIRAAVDRALTDGVSFQEFARELKLRLEELGWWGRQNARDPVSGEVREVQLGSPRRLRTIYRTDLRTAHAAGQWDRAQRTKRLRPYFLYRLGPSQEHRQQHVRWNGVILPVDDKFWSSHYPPNGWGCKCYLRQIAQREHDRLMQRGGYTRTAPDIKTREWTNRRTGEVTTVPEGIDPGWNVNPGKDRARLLARLLSEKLQAAHPADRQAARSAWND